jgi:AraC-like DNA-binding protein
MKYQSFLPCAALAEFVRNYTIIHFQFEKNTPIPSKQRAPKAEQKIVFYIKGAVTFKDADTGDTYRPSSVSVFSHQLDRKILQVTPEFFALVIYLKPGALYRLIQMPIREFESPYYDAEPFFGNKMKSIREELAEAKSGQAMIAIVERFLTGLHKSTTKSPVDIVASRVLDDSTSLSIDEMAKESCLSSRQFYRKFVERIGISPKFFSRLSRFNHAHQYKLMHREVTWSSIAQEFRYTDYHHMEKEFKSFLGVTPTEWIDVELAAPERILKLR